MVEDMTSRSAATVCALLVFIIGALELVVQPGLAGAPGTVLDAIVLVAAVAAILVGGASLANDIRA